MNERYSQFFVLKKARSTGKKKAALTDATEVRDAVRVTEFPLSVSKSIICLSVLQASSAILSLKLLGNCC